MLETAKKFIVINKDLSNLNPDVPIWDIWVYYYDKRYGSSLFVSFYSQFAFINIENYSLVGNYTENHINEYTFYIADNAGYGEFINNVDTTKEFKVEIHPVTIFTARYLNTHRENMIDLRRYIPFVYSNKENIFPQIAFAMRNSKISDDIEDSRSGKYSMIVYDVDLHGSDVCIPLTAHDYLHPGSNVRIQYMTQELYLEYITSNFMLEDTDFICMKTINLTKIIEDVTDLTWGSYTRMGNSMNITEQPRRQKIMNVYDTASPTYAEDPLTKDNSIRPVRYAIPDDMNSFICKVSDLGIGDVFYDDISEFYFTVEFTKKIQSKEFGVPDTVCSVIGSTSSSTYCPFERKYVVPYDRTVRKVDDIILQMEGDEENELG